MKLLIKAIAKILGFRLDSELINTEVMLSIIETYVDGLPIPNSSNLLISEVEEYLLGGFVYFSSLSDSIIFISSFSLKSGSS